MVAAISLITLNISMTSDCILKRNIFIKKGLKWWNLIIIYHLKNSGEWVWNSRAKFKEGQWQQGITTGTEFCVYSVLKYSRLLCHNGVVVSMSEFKSSGLGRYPDVANMICFSMFWYSECFVKEKQTPYFILVVWSALVVGGCLMTASGRNSYLGTAEISSVVCTWLNSRMGDAG